MIKAKHKTSAPASNLSPADQTRAALIHSALKLFGRQGFDGTSTREIAAMANANIGSIAYHFGGKDGLHAACADFIVEAILNVARSALDRPDQPVDARTALTRTLERMVSFFVVSPQAADIAQFVTRQLSQPSAALDRLYEGVVEPTHRQLCQLWQQATGEPAESEATRITVFTLVGQVVYFRIARAVVLRRMDWTGIGEREEEAIAAVAKDNLEAMLAARKGKTS